MRAQQSLAVILVVIAYVAWETGYQADPQVLARIATGGQPLGRWKEGLMLEGIAPMPWLKSAANWFPGTEEVLR